MKTMGRIVRWLRHLAFGAKDRRELDEEMAFHVEALTEDLVKQGMDPRQARREARIRFGIPEQVHQRAREQRGLAMVDEVARNTRIAGRGLVRNPVYTMAFVGTLALCIGLTTAVMAVVDATLWRPMPYPTPERLAHAVMYNVAVGKSAGATAVDGRTWERVRDEAGFLQRAVYAAWARGVNLSTDDAAAFVQQQRVGAGYFSTLGVAPFMGREFEAAEDVPGGPAVAILSHGLWSRTFGGDPSILGEAIELKGEAFTVVGIMPEEFRSYVGADVWTPLRPTVNGEGGGTNYAALVRIPEGMSFEEADARLASIAPPESENPEVVRRFGLIRLDEALNAGARDPMQVLLAGVLLMFLVGCANLAGLQIARTLSRRPEMATRKALGSGTAALVRQAMAENLLLGTLGAAGGLVVAAFAIRGMEGLAQAHFGVWQPVPFDARVVSGALAVSAVATFLFALVPIGQVTKTTNNRALMAGSRVVGGGGHVLRKAILVGQVAVVTALLFGAGMLARSYGYLMSLDPGFNADGVVTVQLSLDDARYAGGDEVLRLFDEGLAGMRAVPGVTAAAVSLTLPYERPLNFPFQLAGEQDRRVTNAVYVTPGFFETLEIPLLQGRDLDETDRGDAPLAVVVSQAFVDQHLQDRAPVGARLLGGLFGEDGATIVGVVGDVQQTDGLGGSTRPVRESPTLYLAAAQLPANLFQGVHVWFSPHWLVRGSTSDAELSAQVAQVFRQVAPDLAVARTVAMRDVMAQAFARQRLEAGFLVAVAAFALLLAGIGLYGIVAYEVMERRSEMGLRMALGATPGEAVWATGVSGMRLTALGLLVGSLAAAGVSRVVQKMVWGVEPLDPLVLTAMVAALAVLGTTASFIPAARIGRLDPATVLREG